MPDLAEIDYVVTYLEMARAPQAAAPALPDGFTITPLANPDLPDFFALYDGVGQAYHWTDKHSEPQDAVRAFVTDPAVEIWRLVGPFDVAGFFMLDYRQAGLCDLAYFGLMPDCVGRGLGPIFLAHALDRAWYGRATVARVTVNTCTLDHPSALALYRRAGFDPIRQEPRRRVIAR